MIKRNDIYLFKLTIVCYHICNALFFGYCCCTAICVSLFFLTQLAVEQSLAEFQTFNDDYYRITATYFNFVQVEKLYYDSYINNIALQLLLIVKQH